MNTANLSFSRAEILFEDEGVIAAVYSREEAKMHVLFIRVDYRDTNDDLDIAWHVSPVAQIFDSLSQIFSAVEHLTLQNTLTWRYEVDRHEWHNLLRSFSNVKVLHFDYWLIGELSNSLQSADGELLWSCYLNCRSSRLWVATMSVTHSLHLSMHARMQATL